MQASTAQPVCLRCFTRSVYRTETLTAGHRAAFSTSASLSATPPKKKTAVAKPTSRQGKTFVLKKNTRAATSRPPAQGERKAQRKRVVLSNVNALEVQGLLDLTAEKVSGGKLQSLQGQVLGFKEATVDALRALEAFKPTQGWGLFRRPASLVRKETVELASDLEWVAAAPGEGRSVKKLLCGERGSGKSVLQLQALAMASLKGWIVMHIPEAKDITNAQTAYQPITVDGETLYMQSTYTAKLLENLSKANQDVLSKLRLSKPPNLPFPVQENISLDRFADLGAKDPELAYPVWQALWSELRQPSSTQGEGLQRPPILFSVDSVDHIMRISAYLDAEMQPIHAHDLALVRDFSRVLTEPAHLPNGGIILAAVSESNRAATPTLDFCLKQNLARQSEQKVVPRDLYFAYDARVQAVLQDVGVMKLQGLSKEEARGIMEYYARSGMLRNTVTDVLVSEKWTLAGGGIVGQLEKGSVRLRF